jgi:CO/xanthine dehydrogenase Mo-binding subunit
MTEISSQPRRFDRRKFMLGTGAMVVAVSTPRLLDPKSALAAASEFPIGPALVDPTQLDSWLAIKGDGTVVVKTGKEELGQGMLTAVTQMVADELDVSLDKITHINADTWYAVNQGGTSGSNSSPTQFNLVRDGAQQQGIRKAAANARVALLNLASTALGEPVSNLVVKDGVVSTKTNAKQTTYQALIGDKNFNVPVSNNVAAKRFQDYKIVGTPVPRIDIPDKVFAKFTYNHDIRLPGMVHARVVRPPTHDSTLVSINGFSQKVPGFLRVVVKKNFVAVVAEREEQAIAAAKSLRVKWNTAPLPAYETLYDQLVAMAPANATNRVLINTNDVDAKLAAPGVKKVEAEYRYPIQIHGPMGASAAQAWVQGNTATIWSHTQNVWAARTMLSTALGIPAANIRVIYVEGSGVYGQTAVENVTLDAAFVSQAIGRPVKVQYTRADDLQSENYGVPYVLRMKGAVDSGGTVTAWDAETFSASRGNRPGPPGNVASGVVMGFPESPIAASPAPTPSQIANTVDGSNSAPHYVIKSQRVVTHTGRLPFFSGPLRSPNRIQNTFANESFIDELAHAAGQDPIAFRLKHLRAPGGPEIEHNLKERLVAAIERTAQLAKWQPKVAASKIGSGRMKTGLGVSAMVYEGDNGVNASIWQVTVDTKTGKVTVDRCWSAQDCGPIINPTGMRMQAEGCLMQTTSRTLIEELKWAPNGITSKDWASYPVIRFNHLPKLTLELINEPDEEVMGAGEVLITNGPAGIANAIFDASGVRLREVPFTPARVRAALKAAGKLTA